MKATRVHVVLVRPDNPANIGAVARVVRNTGLAGLRLVAPEDWRSLECWRSAWKAHDVLEAVQTFEALAPALAPATYTVAFSGRRERGTPTLDVRAVAAEVATLGTEDDACLVFGPEGSGLTLEELASCGRRASIPSHPAQPSFNLSHAVLLAAYEIMRAVALPTGPDGLLATHAQKEDLLQLLRPGLDLLGALPPARPDPAFRRWRTFVQRLDLTLGELGLLENLARRLSRPRVHS